VKFNQVLCESETLCEKCGTAMVLVPNPGLADANEYECPNCKNKKIVGWSWPIEQNRK